MHEKTETITVTPYGSVSTVTINDQQDAIDETKRPFICDCGRQTPRNRLYKFPGTLDGSLTQNGFRFIGGNKKMCVICYRKSWQQIRKGSALSGEPEVVTHIHTKNG